MSTELVQRPEPIAVWPLKHRWIAAILFALIPVVFTAGGSAAGQVLGLDDTAAVWVIAAAVAISAAIGLLVMGLSRQGFGAYGFRRAVNTRTVWWFAPPVITVLLVLATSGVTISGPLIVAYAALVIAVAINEETWFRGIIVALLRRGSIRSAISGSAVLFGVLHLAGLAGGADPVASGLQVLFAVLFGVIAAELVVITGSLWPAIAWHATWDFVSYLGGNSSAPLPLIGVGVACVVMLVYAVRLWRPALSMES